MRGPLPCDGLMCATDRCRPSRSWEDFSPRMEIQTCFNYPQNHQPWAVHQYVAQLSAVALLRTLGASFRLRVRCCPV